MSTSRQWGYWVFALELDDTTLGGYAIMARKTCWTAATLTLFLAISFSTASLDARAPRADGIEAAPRAIAVEATAPPTRTVQQPTTPITRERAPEPRFVIEPTLVDELPATPTREAVLPTRGDQGTVRDMPMISVVPDIPCDNPATLGHFTIKLTDVDNLTAGEVTFTWEVCQTQTGGSDFPGLSHWNLSLMALDCIGHGFSPKDLIKAVTVGGEPVGECPQLDDEGNKLLCWSYGKDGSLGGPEIDWFKFDELDFSGCETFSITFDTTKLQTGYTLTAGCVDGAVKAGAQSHFGIVGGPVCSFDQIPVDPICETAYAYLEDESTCFSDLREVLGLKANNWGWSIGPLQPGDEVVADLRAGAGRCAGGEVVGTVSIKYIVDDFENGVSWEEHSVEVVYMTDDGNELVEVHLYAGCDPLASQMRGNNKVYTTAPGLYPYDDEDATDRDETSARFVIDLGEGCGEDGIYVVAHSVVCYTPAE